MDLTSGGSNSSENPEGPQFKPTRTTPAIKDLASWLRVYARLIGVLLLDAATSKEEAAGLAAHLQVVLQVVQNLRGRQWLMYDWEYREWAAAKGVRAWGGDLNLPIMYDREYRERAAAKGVRAWGDLNLPIYGRCLQRPAMFAAAVTLDPSTTSVFQME